MIAAQLLFDPRNRLIGAGIGIGRVALGMQRDLRIEMNGAFGAEPKTVPRQRDVAGIAAVEYLPNVSAIRSPMRTRKASPMSRFLPDTRNDMAASTRALDST